MSWHGGPPPFKTPTDIRRLMALIELADSAGLGCSQLVVCLSRLADAAELNGLMRDLRWVGFGLVTLAAWTQRPEMTSEEWLFLGMDV